MLAPAGGHTVAEPCPGGQAVGRCDEVLAGRSPRHLLACSCEGAQEGWQKMGLQGWGLGAQASQDGTMGRTTGMPLAQSDGPGAVAVAVAECWR